MDLSNFYSFIFKIWRSKRMLQFKSILQPSLNDKVLDVGGSVPTWTAEPQFTSTITTVNIEPVKYVKAEHFPNHDIQVLQGDGCALNYEDGSFEILFSNSVIEHVGDWEKQKQFAAETRRVGKKLWIQTPAYECPLEPHFLAPFVHWLPVCIRRKVLRWLTPWGILSKPSQQVVDDTIAHTVLLSKREMRELYPDCQIITERLLWVIPKSYVAWRA